jgi:predicted aldo/keto reductase-like oxidoreductase
MSRNGPSRRQFLRTSAALAGAAAFSPGLAFGATTQVAKRTATDQVALGKTGIMLSRLGLGTGSMGGHSQAELGKEGFIKLVQYCFDQQITYLDCAQAYETFKWMGDAIKGLPREKLFIQSKIPGQPKDVLATIDNHRSVYQTDYVDSMLIHCMVKPGWTDEWKRIMDGFNEAKEKKWIRAKGVSCHTLPALQAANQSDFNEVHLVRVNPMGAFMDVVDSKDHWGEKAAVDPVLQEIESMHKKGRGVIGMKICGNGTFTDPKDREKSIRFAMNNPNIDAVVIGMKSVKEVDENVGMINRALAG